MKETLDALGEIVLNSLPTFFLVILLYFFLKQTFFKPLEKTLARRFDATEGARKAAEESLRLADARIAEYEAAIRDARGEIYKEQEQFHKQMQEEHAAKVEIARREANARLEQAKAELAAETENARRSLAAESDMLAGQIAETVLRRRAA